MNCTNCGAELSESTKFCPNCGTRVAHSCPNCGAALQNNPKFCPECGTSLTAAVATVNQVEVAPEIKDYSWITNDGLQECMGNRFELTNMLKAWTSDQNVAVIEFDEYNNLYIQAVGCGEVEIRIEFTYIDTEDGDDGKAYLVANYVVDKHKEIELASWDFKSVEHNEFSDSDFFDRVALPQGLEPWVEDNESSDSDFFDGLRDVWHGALEGFSGEQIIDGNKANWKHVFGGIIGGAGRGLLEALGKR